MSTIDKNSLWQSVLTELQLTLSGANFQTWFKGKTNVLSFDNSVIEIGCASPYNRVWIEERYLGQIKEIVDRITGTSNTLVFTVSSEGLSKMGRISRPVETRTVPLFEEAAVSAIQEPLEAADLNQKYSFSNFVVGQTNQLADAASLAVAEAPHERYNPLLVYGGVGVGKTHLLQAIGQAVLLRRVGVRVFYCSSETFTKEMVEAIQKRRTIDFRAKYRNVDLLLVDDIQFIAGRESTQEEFFHTFNQLYSRGKQLVFSCDRNPRDLANLQERLKSRFAGGLIVAIEPPELELREAILLAKAKETGAELDISIIRYLAENLGPSVRDLEGGLLRVSASAKLTGRKIDLSLVKTAIGERRRQEEKTPTKVMEETASFFSIPVSEIRGARRVKSCAFPRQVAMYLLRKEMGLSFKEVAQEFAGRDHTTAIYSVNKVESLVEKGGEVARLVQEIRGRIFHR
jgi:chromosomal replication initiator protein